jgi:hypothetical protein
MRNGRACGGRSRYSRPGGPAPLCYPSDVTAAMIDTYRQRQASRETCCQGNSLIALATREKRGSHSSAKLMVLFSNSDALRAT